MKFKIKYLIYLVVCFMTFTNVYAADYSVGDTLTVSSTGIKSSVSLKRYETSGSSTSSATYLPYTNSAVIDGIEFDIYCLDPNAAGYAGTYKVTDVYLDNYSSLSTKEQYYQTAMVYLYAYSDSGAFSYLSEEQLYVATLVAVRALYVSKGDTLTSTTDISAIYLSTYYNMAYIWNSSSELSSTVSSLNASYKSAGNSGTLIQTASNYSYVNGSYYYYGSSDVIDAAKEMYIYAIKNMTNENAKNASITVSDTNSQNGDNYEIVATFTPQDYSDQATLSDFTIKNISNSKISFTCQIVKSSGVESYSCSKLEGINFSDEGITKIIVTASIPIDDLDLSSINSEFSFDIDYEINDPLSNLGTLYIIKPVNATTTQSYALYDSDHDFSGTLSADFSLDNCTNCCETEIDVPTDCIDVDGGTSQWYSSSITPDKDVMCIIDNTDDAGNSYTAEYCEYNIDGTLVSNNMEGVTNNDYCTVSCTEDYYDITFPGVREADSGRYFRISASISSEKTCYTSEIDYEQFEDDVEAAQEAMESAYTAYKNASSTSAKTTAQKNLESAQDAYDAAINGIVSCSGGKTITSSSSDSISGWDMIYPLNPEIKYDYEENYINDSDLINDKNNYMVVSSESVDSTSYGYCSSLNSNGDCVSGSTTKFANQSFTYCTTSSCKTVTYYNFPTENLNYVVGSINKEVTYSTPDVFYTAFPSGDIVYQDKDVIDDTGELQVELVDGLPISITTEQGLYSFSFELENLGEYYDECLGGRLNDVINVLASDNDDDSNEYGFTGEYVCNYVVNPDEDYENPDEDCPDCLVDGDFDFDLPFCDPDGSNCTPCVTCLVNGSLNLYFRSISTNSTGNLADSFNPNDRDLGYNWNYTYDISDSTYGFISGKAEATVTEIYSLGDAVYDDDPILTVTLTPGIASEIKAYNASVDNYSNDTLTCSDYGNYENIFCYSDLLTEWETEYPDNFEFYSDRSSVTSYWTTYTVNINTTYSIGGPSWK